MRRASSMLELVVAIVVMSIAMMTLPLMLEQTQRNNEIAMKQEALLAARTQLGDMSTYPWDENSLKSNKIAILDVNSSSTPASLHRIDVNSTRRIGHVAQDKRRKFFDSSIANNEASSTFGFDAGDGGIIDDIDDFDSSNFSLVDSGENTSAGLDYRFSDVNMSTSVYYVGDNLTFFGTSSDEITDGSTNVKLIELSVSGVNLDGTITLRTYVSNIGESEYLRRDY